MGSASDSESESELKGEDSWRSATSDFCVETSVSTMDALRRRNNRVKVREAGRRGLKFRKKDMKERWHKPHLDQSHCC